MIIECLPTGKENAISTITLCGMTGLSVRKLRAEVAKERIAGELILSRSDGGYYIPSNRGEVEEFVRTLDSKGRSIMVALQSARKYLRDTLPEANGQLEIAAFEPSARPCE